MIRDVTSLLAGTPAFEALVERLAGDVPGPPAVVHGAAGSLDALLASLLQETLRRQVLVVARDPERAERLRDDLRGIAGEHKVHFFGARHRLAASGEAHHQPDDIETLQALLAGATALTVTHPAALASGLPRPSTLNRRSLTVETGGPVSFDRLVDALRGFAFTRADFVQSAGEFAVRGGIVDVFPFVGEHPVRIEFFGEQVESIREFDPLSQRSIRELAAASIVPDLLAGDEGGAAHASLLEFLAAGAVLMLDEPDVVRAEMDRYAARSPEQAAGTDRLEELLPLLHQVHLRGIRSGGDDALDIGGLPQPAFNASVRMAHEGLAKLQQEEYTLFLSSDTQAEEVRLRELLEMAASGEEPATAPLDLTRITFSHDALHEGFLIPEQRIAVFTEHQIFNRLKRRGRKQHKRFKGLREGDLQKLRRGDLVVHMDYGIGRFDGLHRIRVRGVEQEAVKVLYAEKDTLYVHLGYINRLQKYSAGEGHVPKLTRIGTGEWDRLKQKAKKRIKDIARDLIRLYARRKQAKGFACPADTPWQKEMEASFLYEDTFDQAKATREVKEDMEQEAPMDRLICGDVGFGKTEVAVRAAFKAVTAGRQVAVLVPTTILALQHESTFQDRLGRYGVRIASLSRLKARKHQLAVLQEAAAGAVDILIGTHRLLSADVRFKDLGLLIVDEEHRFGVSAKEKLRQRKVDVDTLTLTATPIPRTLHFSLMGARDLSIIATPPRNRLPVITEITQFTDHLVREAVLREVQRHGQVYFVHDRIQNIADITERLRNLLPGVRIRFAHGQMTGAEIEEAMLAFHEKRCDVLVSTKIVESGLDIPNANTIIVNRADRFGMAELYQLRGRVGRSNQQAYAYFLTPPFSVLPKATLQRLQALEEFTDLGSGFHLAMRDLEIRGTGNLLGAEQSGFVETMGFETYTRVLEEAVAELKEEEFRELFAGRERRGPVETVVEADLDALLPESYVENSGERLAVYRKLYGVGSGEQLEEVATELRDRFGAHPAEVENLFALIRVKLEAQKVGLVKVSVGGGEMEADFPPDSDTAFYGGEEFQELMTRIGEMRGSGVTLRQTGKTLKLVARLRGGEELTHASALLRSLQHRPAPAALA